MDKISTSIQYQYTNIRLFNQIFGADYKVFFENLNKGPENMKQFLAKSWNDLKTELIKNDNLILKDVNKDVTKDDFDITFNITKNNIQVYYFTFPDYEYNDAASKYVALALGSGIPRFFTLEYSEDFITHQRNWTVGEFCVDQKTYKQIHMNYGKCDNDRLTWFSGFVVGILELDNKEK